MHFYQSLILVLILSQCPHLHVVGADSSGDTAPDLTKVRIAAGYGHTVLIKDDGTLWAWGDNQAVLTVNAASPGTVVAVAGEDQILENPVKIWRKSPVPVAKSKQRPIGIPTVGSNNFAFQRGSCPAERIRFMRS
jgi:hypothetical protein